MIREALCTCNQKTRTGQEPRRTNLCNDQSSFRTASEGGWRQRSLLFRLRQSLALSKSASAQINYYGKKPKVVVYLAESVQQQRPSEQRPSELGLRQPLALSKCASSGTHGCGSITVTSAKRWLTSLILFGSRRRRSLAFLRMGDYLEDLSLRKFRKAQRLKVGLKPKAHQVILQGKSVRLIGHSGINGTVQLDHDRKRDLLAAIL